MSNSLLEGLSESEKKIMMWFTFHPDVDSIHLDKKTMPQQLDTILNALCAFEMLSLIYPVKK